ncbi:MAG: type II toxin-antitoxin system HicB family antitoxin [Candidatus Pacebacteria bacterium]|nr:type II toxin-antitoxin system HicB family antitoxin [Candidatus Paceibacterota bacterium]
MKTIAQFKVYKGEKAYIAEGVDLAIVTQADDLDQLVKNIEEAVAIHLEGENISELDYSQKPSILVSYELSQHA